MQPWSMTLYFSSCSMLNRQRATGDYIAVRTISVVADATTCSRSNSPCDSVYSTFVGTSARRTYCLARTLMHNMSDCRVAHPTLSVRRDETKRTLRTDREGCAHESQRRSPQAPGIAFRAKL